MAGLARWCYRHRVVVLLIWLAALGMVFGLQRAFGNAYSDEFSLPGAESTQAFNLIKAYLPEQSRDSGTIVWHTSQGTVEDSTVKARIQPLLEGVAAAPSVAAVASPYGAEGAAQISKDGKTAYATVTLTGKSRTVPKADILHLIDLTKAASSAGLQVDIGGDAIDGATEVSLSSSAAIGLGAAALIILLAFGSFFGMLLPLITAGFALGLTLLGIDLLSHGVAINSVSPTMAVVVGLGVGIDYALFIVTRYRQGIKEGMESEAAAVRALNTAGRAVLFAGATVCVALLGLLILNVRLLDGLAYSTVFAVGLTMATAVTLLPALLGFMGVRVLSRRERRHLAETGPSESHKHGFWTRLGGWVSRRPVTLAVCSGLVMVLLAVPFLSLRLGFSDAGNGSSSSTTRRAYDLLSEGFGPGSNGPLLLVAQMGSSKDGDALQGLAKTLESTPGVAAVQAYPYPEGSPLGVIEVVPTTSPQDARTSELISRLRTVVIPAGEAGTSLHVLVGGSTAVADDFAGVIKSKLPLFLAIIVSMGFLLLFVAFRSLIVPLTAAIMNLLAAAASFGVVVAIFQWGWGAELLGLGRSGPVEAFQPVLMLAVLFGLSMDYQVFLVSRMRVEWVSTRDNRRAIIMGQAATGRIITAAAAIMICVFGAFIFGGQRVVAQFGVGLATAVFLDAFVLRTILVPALMHVLGRSNWHLPRLIDRWLPHIAVEPSRKPGSVTSLP
jgi:RND superfamily putative drug exporter